MSTRTNPRDTEGISNLLYFSRSPGPGKLTIRWQVDNDKKLFILQNRLSDAFKDTEAVKVYLKTNAGTHLVSGQVLVRNVNGVTSRWRVTQKWRDPVFKDATYKRLCESVSKAKLDLSLQEGSLMLCYRAVFKGSDAVSIIQLICSPVA
jgi:hypothetical protein